MCVCGCVVQTNRITRTFTSSETLNRKRVCVVCAHSVRTQFSGIPIVWLTSKTGGQLQRKQMLSRAACRPHAPTQTDAHKLTETNKRTLVKRIALERSNSISRSQ